MNDFSKNFNYLTDPFSYSKLSQATVGFDDVFKRLAAFAGVGEKLGMYPPYNIKKTGENTYVIEVAVAGFGKQDIELTLEDGILTLKGQIEGQDPSEYLFKGIADRAFTRKFTLADSVEIKNADLINGMLKIWLEKLIPETAKPKKIDINDHSNNKKGS